MAVAIKWQPITTTTANSREANYTEGTGICCPFERLSIREVFALSDDHSPPAANGAVATVVAKGLGFGLEMVKELVFGEKLGFYCGGHDVLIGGVYWWVAACGGLDGGRSFGEGWLWSLGFGWRAVLTAASGAHGGELIFVVLLVCDYNLWPNLYPFIFYSLSVEDNGEGGRSNGERCIGRRGSSSGIFRKQMALELGFHWSARLLGGDGNLVDKIEREGECGCVKEIGKGNSSGIFKKQLALELGGVLRAEAARHK
ncbi:uncharacterized protein G2W53_033517 [Senna tora]|uniref:Uncharacterized protein n=1 Tax=Senna tora TaxID=362788 RepID=A0A834WB22_9FABA|nr:uncharacterized protein G2W53_033517 [Senna tora]